MINQNLDGSALLVDDTDPTRTQFLPASMSRADQDAAAFAFHPTPVRSATVSTLLDALSVAQRGAISTDHMGRLIARAAIGPVVSTDPKISRAATDMGITPDAWFTLAGC